MKTLKRKLRNSEYTELSVFIASLSSCSRADLFKNSDNIKPGQEPGSQKREAEDTLHEEIEEEPLRIIVSTKHLTLAWMYSRPCFWAAGKRAARISKSVLLNWMFTAGMLKHS